MSNPATNNKHSIDIDIDNLTRTIHQAIESSLFTLTRKTPQQDTTQDTKRNNDKKLTTPRVAENSRPTTNGYLTLK